MMWIFAGGGTGGHLTPGLAVAEQLRRAEPTARIVFVGTPRAIERSLIGSEIEHRTLPVEPSTLLRRNPFKFFWNTWRAWRISRRWLREERPHGVVGLGGFACVPVVLAASQLGIPTILLEQNVIPGRAVRWLARRASAMCVSFPETVPLLPKGTRAVVTGNPVRSEIAALAGTRSTSFERFSLLVLGGSQGAQPINQALIEWVRTADVRGLHIVHQTGAGQDGAVRAAYHERGVSCDVQPFFTDMAERCRQATLAVSRAGATTLAELACAGCPALLIPYPQAVDDHQRKNAELFANAGAARVIAQQSTPEATARLLSPAIDAWRNDESQRWEASACMVQLARPEAAQSVADLLRGLKR